MDACRKGNVGKAKCILSEEGTGQGEAVSAPVGYNHRDLRERREGGGAGDEGGEQSHVWLLAVADEK